MIQQHFFIVGLPRSRTAWMSAFLSQGDVFCHHEALNGSHTKEAFLERMALPGYARVGNADSGLPLIPFQEWFPSAPTLIIERPAEDVVQSLCRLGYGEVAWLPRYLERRLGDLEGLRVPFHGLNDRLEEIWQFLIGPGFDRRRAELFSRLNIQLQSITGDPESLGLKELLYGKS